MLLILWGVLSIAYAKPIELTLENDMTVILDQTSHIPQVSLQLHLGFAPQNYPEGLPHLVEHLLFEMKKDGVLYDHWVEEHQGSSNARTRWSEIIIETTVASSAAEELLRWEAWRLNTFCSSLTSENIENQKLIIVQEMLNQEFRHLGSIPDRLRKATFSSDPIIGAEVMGAVADLEQITQDDICRFAQDVFHPGQARLILAGDIQDITAARLETIFFSRKEEIANPTFNKGEYTKTTWYLPSSSDTRLYIIWRAPAYGSEQEIISDFLLEQLISEQIGVLTEYFSLVSGWSETSIYGGWRVIELQTDNPEQALEIVEQIIRSGDRWIAEKDLQQFQRKTQSLIAKLQLKNTERARLLGECSLAGMGETCFQWEQDRREELSLTVVFEYLEVDYSLDNASLLWIGSENLLEGERLP